MGVRQRQYFGTPSGGWGSGPNSWPEVCRWIVYINIGIFIAQIFFTRESTRDELLAPLLEQELSRERFITTWKRQHRTDFLFDSGESPEEPTTEQAEDGDSNPTLTVPQPGESPDRSDDSTTDLNSEPTPSETPASTRRKRLVVDEEALNEAAEQAYEDQLAQFEQFSGGHRQSVVQEWLQLDTKQVCKGQVWRLITCAFCHDRYGLFHILFNMLGLIWFGTALEQMYGSREFLWFYLAAALTASLAYVGLDLYTGRAIPAIGASGAVMGVLMLFACHFPTYTIRIWWFFPIEMRWLMLLYIAYDLHPVLLDLAGDQQRTGIAHAAHLGGLVFGYIYWKKELSLTPLVDRLQQFVRSPRRRRPGEAKILSFPQREPSSSRRPTPRRTTGPTLADLPNDREQDALDHVLDKIHRSGRESLTAEDLEILER
ncbi:MAG: rhomboid family intramembrane serine protease, partial [Planctomycetaceae bacterium]|nr:rhomboid family intramembrane serine protease [Planctomycetaceae bacterium]